MMMSPMTMYMLWVHMAIAQATPKPATTIKKTASVGFSTFSFPGNHADSFDGQLKDRLKNEPLPNYLPKA